MLYALNFSQPNGVSSGTAKPVGPDPVKVAFRVGPMVTGIESAVSPRTERTLHSSWSQHRSQRCIHTDTSVYIVRKRLVEVGRVPVDLDIIDGCLVRGVGPKDIRVGLVGRRTVGLAEEGQRALPRDVELLRVDAGADQDGVGVRVVRNRRNGRLDALEVGARVVLADEDGPVWASRERICRLLLAFCVCLRRAVLPGCQSAKREARRGQEGRCPEWQHDLSCQVSCDIADIQTKCQEKAPSTFVRKPFLYYKHLLSSSTPGCL